MKVSTLIIAILICLGCKGQTSGNTDQVERKQDIAVVDKKFLVEQQMIKSLEELKLESDAKKEYKEVKASIEAVRIKLKSRDVSLDSIRSSFEKALLHQIIPYWKGTKWTFEGHTSTPQVGTIACGYFVSTTLNHAGVKINRYRLAQQSPINEAKSLSINSEVIEIAEDSSVQNIAAIKEAVPKGIHFIGFDQSHVGYLLKKSDQLYLIHSNYLDAKGVEIEAIEQSEVFASYDRFYIAEISSNEGFLRSWISGNIIEVIAE